MSGSRQSRKADRARVLRSTRALASENYSNAPVDGVRCPGCGTLGSARILEDKHTFVKTLDFQCAGCPAAYEKELPQSGDAAAVVADMFRNVRSNFTPAQASTPRTTAGRSVVILAQRRLTPRKRTLPASSTTTPPRKKQRLEGETITDDRKTTAAVARNGPATRSGRPIDLSKIQRRGHATLAVGGSGRPINLRLIPKNHGRRDGGGFHHGAGGGRSRGGDRGFRRGCGQDRGRGRGRGGPKRPLRTDPHNADLISQFAELNLLEGNIRDEPGRHKMRTAIQNIDGMEYKKWSSLTTGKDVYSYKHTKDAPPQTSFKKPSGWTDDPKSMRIDFSLARVADSPQPPTWQDGDLHAWPTVPCCLNAYEIKEQYDVIHEFDVHIYEKGETDDDLGREIGTDKKDLREDAVVGRKFGVKRKKERFIKRALGALRFVYDTNKLYVIAGPNMTEDVTILMRPYFDRVYRVQFRRLTAFRLTDDDAPKHDSERVLSIVSRAWCERINYHRIGDRTCAFFDMNDNVRRNVIHGNGPDYRNPDLEILEGKQIAIRQYKAHQFLAFINNGFKAVTLHSLGEIARESSWTIADLEVAIPGKCPKAYLSYRNFEEIRMWEFYPEDENDTFDRQGAPISYKDYYDETYNMKVQNETFLVRGDNRREKFLPHLIRLPVSNEMMGPRQDEMRRMMKQNVRMIVEDGNKFVRQSNDRCTSKNQGLQLEGHPKCVEARQLEETELRFCNKNSHKFINVPVSRIKDEWRNVGEQFVRNFQAMSIVIVVPRGDDRVGRDVINHLQGFLRQRRFDAIRMRPPPEIIAVDMRNERRVRDIFRNIQARGVVAVLPRDGAEDAKKAVTRAFYLGTQQENAPVLQCMDMPTAQNFNKARGAFEDLLTKAGCVMYEVIPKFHDRHPSPKIRHENALYVGIHIKSSSSDRRASVACICASTQPFDPVLTAWEARMWLFDPKSHVMTLEKTQQICEDLFEQVLRERQQRDRAWTCSNVFVFRDKGADGDLDIIKTKEMPGVLRAVYKLKKGKINSPFASVLRKMMKNANTVFMTFENKIIEAIGRHDRNRDEVVKATVPIVVDEEVNGLSWQALLHVDWASEGTYKPVRMRVLHDGPGLVEDKCDVMALYQVIYALYFSYGVGIPFSFGCPTLTGPVKYAKHWCDWYSDILDQGDADLRQIFVSNGAVGKPKLFGQNGRFDDADGDVTMRDGR